MLLQDWLDIDFAIKEQVDFIAVSFVKTSDVINNLKSYVESRSSRVSTCIPSSNHLHFRAGAVIHLHAQHLPCSKGLDAHSSGCGSRHLHVPIAGPPMQWQSAPAASSVCAPSVQEIVLCPFRSWHRHSST